MSTRCDCAEHCLLSTAAMRTLLALLLVAIAAPAFAQATYADGTGGYVALHQLGINPIGTLGADATVGYRLRGGLDVGVRLGHETRFGVLRESVAGPVAGITRPVGRGLTGRLEGAVLFSSVSVQQDEVTTADGAVVAASSGRVRALSQDVTATLSRSVRLVGSLRARPTVGAYAEASQALSVSGSVEPGSGRTLASTGLHVELPLSLRVLGRDASVTPVVRLPITGNSDATGAAYAGGGFRLNL